MRQDLKTKYMYKRRIKEPTAVARQMMLHEWVRLYGSLMQESQQLHCTLSIKPKQINFLCHHTPE